MLAPLIAKSPKQQELVYEAFDQWLEQHVTPPKEINSNELKPSEPEVVKQARRAWLKPLVGLLALAAVTILIWILWPKPIPTKPGVHFSLDKVCLQTGQSFSPAQVTVDSSLNRIWDFGDGQQDSSLNPSHRYSQPGSYTISLTVFGESLDSTFQKNVTAFADPLPVAAIQMTNAGDIYTFQADSSHPAWEYLWILSGDTLGRELSVNAVLRPGKEYVARLIVSLQDDETGQCSDEASERVDLNQELVELPLLNPLRAAQDNPPQWTFLAYLSWGLLALLLAAAWVLGHNMWWRYRRRPPGGKSFAGAFTPAKGPPLSLSFPSLDHLITGGEALRNLAAALRQREHSERYFLDVGKTLKATVRRGGLPDVQFTQQSRPIEYLALVERQGPEDQQARLFQQLLKILKDEQVPIEVWYYQEDPYTCFQPDSDKEVSLERLAQVFQDHRLLIFGKGEHWLHPSRPGLRPGLKDSLERWQDRALLTPVPITEWGFREEILHEHLLLLPADLAGQADLMDAWDQRDPLPFDELRLHLLHQRSHEDPWFLMDVQDIDELRDNLGPRRFAWLAAAAIYPRPIWELTVAMGSLFGNDRKQVAPVEKMAGTAVAYEDLLALTRMPWLQNGDLPEPLRDRLIHSLTEVEEQQARELLVFLLNASTPPEGSYAAREKKVQLAVNHAAIQPADAQQQGALELLLKEGLLDPVMRKRVKGNMVSYPWRAQLLRGAAGLAIALLAGFLLIGRMEPRADWASLAEQPVDSLSFYLNKTADVLDGEASQDKFPHFLEKLREFEKNSSQSDYQEALMLYRQAREDYLAQSNDMSQARTGFQAVGQLLASPTRLDSTAAQAATDTTIAYRTSLALHSLHAEGLCWYYLGEMDSAKAVLQSISPAFFLEVEPPNLQTLLGEVNASLDLADTLLILVQDAMVAGNTTQDRIKAYTWLQQIHQLLGGVVVESTADQERTNEITTRSDFLMTGLLNGLYFSGTVNDEAGNPLPGVEVSYYDGNATTDSYGQFRMEVHPEDIWDETIAFLLLRDGFQRKDTTIRIVDLLPMQPFQLLMAETIEQTTAQISVVDVENIYAGLDEALKISQCDRVDSLLKILTKENAGKLNFYQQQREEACGGTSGKFIAPEMVSIPGGTFTMGDVMEDHEYDDRELPLHDVTLRSFQMAATELSFAEYDLFCTATNREKPEDRGWGRGERPVIYVDWYDALEYCNWLSEQMGYRPVYRIDKENKDPRNTSSSDDKQWTVTADWTANGFRLPTEAEWEYAARQAGQKVRFGNGRDTADTDEINFYGLEDEKKPYSKVGQYREQTLPVRSLRSNSLGLYHMSGNVYEWCWDWYGSYGEAAQRNPYGSQSGFLRVLRGGSWLLYPVFCRTAYRYDYYPDGGNRFIGFRLTRTP